MIRVSLRTVRPSTTFSWKARHFLVPGGCHHTQAYGFSGVAPMWGRPKHSNKPKSESRDRENGGGPRSSHRQPPRDTGELFEVPKDAGNNQNDQKPIIKWYKQLTPWSRHRKLSDPDNPDDDDDGMARRVKQQIDRLDAELKAMEDRPFEPFMKHLTPEDRAVVEKEVEKTEVQEKQEEKELENYLPKLRIEWTLPIQQRTYLKELNDSIKESLLKYQSYSVRRNLWRSYARCKSFLPPFLHLIPAEAWLALYRAQAEAATRDDAHWASRLIELIEDMRAVGRQLAADQIVMLIEALRFEDQTHAAVMEWEALRKYVGNDTRLLAEYELLGVRLFTSQGDLSTAERIASKYLESDDGSEARILLPIMETWIDRQDAIGMQHAWALYLTIKMQLGSSITMDDYDNICARFMSCGRTDLALAVFKDMMLTGIENGHDSVALYQQYKSNLDMMSDTENKIPQINEIYLTSLTVVPEAYQNKFFYAKWLKKLIGTGDAEAAGAVVELMFERGVRPDAKHLNGIIGAYLRSTIEHQQSKAEQIAWAMIGQRLAFVRERPSGHLLGIEEVVDRAQGKGLSLELPRDQKRSFPSATVETYALLLQFYARRSRFEDIKILDEALKAGQIQPNAYWTNHLLWMLLRNHETTKVWNLFVDSFSRAIQPDMDTFACLWKSEEMHLKHSKAVAPRAEDFPAPRAIFSHMCNLPLQERPSQDLYLTIIRCFLRSQDLSGAIVAIYALKERDGLYPKSKTVRDIVRLVAQQTLQPLEVQQHGYGGHRSRVPQAHRAQSAAFDLLKIARRRRSERLVAAGFDDPIALNEDIVRNEALALMVDFLKEVFQMSEGVADVDSHVKQAASEMGLRDICTVDYLYSGYRV